MTIQNQTAYTYDCLTEFNRQHQRTSKLIMTIVSAVLGGLTCLTLIFSGLLTILNKEAALDMQTVIVLLFILLLVVFRLYVAPLLIKRTIRKQAALNTITTYRFIEDYFEDTSESTVKKEQSQCRYSMITKVTESERYFYLYISPTAAHIVDKQGFTDGTEEELRILLRTVIDGKKIHIQ